MLHAEKRDLGVSLHLSLSLSLSLSKILTTHAMEEADLTICVPELESWTSEISAVSELRIISSQSLVLGTS